MKQLLFHDYVNYYEIDYDTQTINTRLLDDDNYRKDGIISMDAGPKNIAFLTLESIDETKITLKIEEYAVITKNQWTNEVNTIEKRKNSRYFIIHMKDGLFEIKKARSSKSFPLGNGKSLRDIIYQQGFTARTTLCIAKEDFYKDILNYLNTQIEWKYVSDLEQKNVERSNDYSGGPNADILSEFHIYDKNHTHIKIGSTAYKFANQLATLCYYIGNPGLENIMKTPTFSTAIFTTIYKSGEEIPKGKLHESLGVTKQTLKAINYTTDVFAKQISIITNADTTIMKKESLLDLLSKSLYDSKISIEKFILQLNGFNNYSYFVSMWASENFYQLYYLTMNRLSGRWFYRDNPQNCFDETIRCLLKEFLKVIFSCRCLLSEEPTYAIHSKRFSDYVCTLMRKQGFTDLSNGIRTWEDYIRMQKMQNVTFEKYPKNIATVHNIAQMNNAFYQIVNDKKSIKIDGFQEAVEAYSSLEWKRKDKAFCIITPANFNELFLEGASLNHCVSSYISKVASGESKILFLRKCDDTQMPYFTIEVVDDKIKHVKGQNQCNPDVDVIMFISDWAKIHNLVEDYLFLN